jgi:RNA polymerase sigma factor (sigma-70 family)
MTTSALTPVLRCLARLAGTPASDLSDADLLERFCARGEEAAFTLLVQRHGPAVLGVCHRVLGNAADADDAFQATFLVLLRNAASIRKRPSLGCWLYGVAWHVATKARARRQCVVEFRDGHALSTRDPIVEAARHELLAVLDEEIRKLPENLRAALILCGLEGKTYEQAAHELRFSKSTLARRVEDAREMLRARLLRRGVSVSSALLTTVLAREASAAVVPAILTLSTVRLARQTLLRSVPATSAVTLAKQVAQGTAVTRWLLVLGLSVAVGLAVVAAGSFREESVTLPDPPSSAAKSASVVTPAPANDRDDFPLPAEAVARVGSPRLRHGRFLSNLTYSPDGSRLTTAGQDWLRLWDARTGNLVRQIDTPGGDRANSGVFSADGKVLFVVDGESCRRFDGRTGEEKPSCNIIFAKQKQIYLSPHGELAIVFESDAVVYELPSAKERFRLVSEGAWFGGLAFTADGKTMALVESVGKQPTNDYRVRLFDTATGKPLGGFDLGSIFRGLSFSADGKKLLAYNPGIRAKNICVWSVPDGKLLHTIEADVNALTAVAFTPDAKSIIAGSQSSDALRIDLTTGKELTRFHTGFPSSTHFAFSPDGKVLAIGVIDGIVSRWDYASGKRLDAPEDIVDSAGPVFFDATGRLLKIWDNGLLTADWQSGRVEHGKPVPHRMGVFCLAVSPDQSRSAGVNDAHKTAIWDNTTGKEVSVLALEPNAWQCLAFAPDNKTLYTARWNSPVQAWDADNGKELFTLDLGHDSGHSLVVSPNGRLLALTDHPQARNPNREITVADLANRLVIRRLLPPANSLASKICFSQDSNYLAAVGGNKNSWDEKKHGFVAVWDIRTGKERFITSEQGDLQNVAFSADGRTLVTGSKDGSVRLWEVATGQQRHRFAGHDNYVCNIAFSPDGKFVASISTDAPVYVWDVEGCHGKASSAVPFTDNEGTALWKTLSDSKPTTAFDAMRQLWARPAPAIALLRSHLQPTPAVDEKTVRKYLQDLDADDFATRQKAVADLEAIIDSAEPFLRKALENKPSAGVKRHIEEILDLASITVPDRLRSMRVVEVVEHVGTSEARKFLDTLAGGADGALVTREAKAALERLKQR